MLTFHWLFRTRFTRTRCITVTLKFYEFIVYSLRWHPTYCLKFTSIWNNKIISFEITNYLATIVTTFAHRWHDLLEEEKTDSPESEESGKNENYFVSLESPDDFLKLNYFLRIFFPNFAQFSRKFGAKNSGNRLAFGNMRETYKKHSNEAGEWEKRTNQRNLSPR